MVVVVLVVLLELSHPRLDLCAVEHAVGEEEPFDRSEPALVVAPAGVRALAVLALPGRDLRDQLAAEPLPLEGWALRQCHRDPEGAALPRLVEDKLAVRARRRRGASRVCGECVRNRARPRHGLFGSPVPIIASRVTSAAS